MSVRRTYQDILKEYELETLENADLRYCDLQGAKGIHLVHRSKAEIIEHLEEYL